MAILERSLGLKVVLVLLATEVRSIGSNVLLSGGILLKNAFERLVLRIRLFPNLFNFFKFIHVEKLVKLGQDHLITLRED